MSIDERIKLVEECMDLPEGTLKLDDNLSKFDEWDSLAGISLISIIDEKFNKTISGDDIKKAKLVSDIVNMME